MAEEVIEKTEETKVEKSSKGWIWTTIVIIVMVAFGAFTVKTFIDNHNRNKDNTADNNNNVSRDNIAQEFQPPATGQTNAPDIRGPESVPNKPTVLGSETNTTPAQTTPVEPIYVPYRNDTFGFSTMVPSDAQFKTDGNQLTVGSPQGTYFTITQYTNTNENLDTVETQLHNSPSVTSVARVNLGGIPALQFTSPNFSNSTNYAFIVNGRLYYLIGNFSRVESWKDFKFF